MKHLLKAFRPVGARRGPRRPGIPSPFPQGNHRAPQTGILAGLSTEDAQELELAILCGQYPEYVR